MNVLSTIITLIAFLLSITFHEFCHALCALLLGDDTAKRLGRLTLNPLAHIDPLGLLCLIFFRIGWAKPVPFNPQNFTHPRLFSVFVGLAGPLSNFFLALLSMYGVKYFPTETHLDLFLHVSVWVNIMLGLFNLIPLPPLDGSHLVHALIPDSWQPAYAAFTRFSFLLLLLLIMLPSFNELFQKAILVTTNALQAVVF
jgi:Zn-dependent protease